MAVMPEGDGPRRSTSQYRLLRIDATGSGVVVGTAELGGVIEVVVAVTIDDEVLVVSSPPQLTMRLRMMMVAIRVPICGRVSDT